MKKRIAMFAVVLFVTGMFVSVSQAAVAANSNDVTMSASTDCQATACGESCDKAKEGCEKSCPKKDGCDKSGEQKKECPKGESGGCQKKAAE